MLYLTNENIDNTSNSYIIRGSEELTNPILFLTDPNNYSGLLRSNLLFFGANGHLRSAGNISTERGLLLRDGNLKLFIRKGNR